MHRRAVSGEVTGGAPGRWHGLDWLRVTGIGLVFAFHCGRFFDHLWWHVKDATPDARFTTATLLLSQWVMPLFFLIAGAAAELARSASSNPDVSRAGARVRRLLVPFVFGVFVLVPPQVYFERLHDGSFRGSFFTFYPHYFDGLYFFGGNFSWIGHHLWFLPALFIVSVIVPILLRPLERGKARVARLADVCDRVGAPVFFGTPVLLAHLVLRPVGLVDPVCYVLFYAFGTLLAAEPRFLRAVRRTGTLALVLAIVSSALFARAFTSGGVALGDLSRYSLTYIGMQTLAGIGGWLWPQALVALCSRDRVNRGSALLRYANEGVLPFYVLHQTIVIAVGYYVLPMQASAPGRFAVVVAIAMPLTLVIYEVLIRRLGPARVLFGMRPPPGVTR